MHFFGPAKTQSRREHHPTVPIVSFKFCKNAFSKKNIEKWTCRNDADPRCQKEAVPERAKNCATYSLFDFFHHVFAAQLPTRVFITSVGSGPHSPRPKDYPGLGNLTPSNYQ